MQIQAAAIDEYGTRLWRCVIFLDAVYCSESIQKLKGKEGGGTRNSSECAQVLGLHWEDAFAAQQIALA